MLQDDCANCASSKIFYDSIMLLLVKTNKRLNNFSKPIMKLCEWIAQRQVTFVFNKLKVVYIRWNYLHAFYKIT